MAKQQADKEQEPIRTKIFRKFKGVVNNSSRNTLPEEAWSYLENIQPIGDANAQTVPNIAAAPLIDYGAHIAYWAQYVSLNGNTWVITFCTDGYTYAYNLTTSTFQIITGGGPVTLSGSGSRIAQWKNQQALIIDSTGYYAWSGSGTPIPITGTGVPTSGNDIAVAFNRVWILQGRAITFSGANDYTAPSFLPANGAGSVILTDPMLRDVPTRLFAQNGYLYIIAASGINIISDVYVPSGASPPVPLFTNLNIQGLIGSAQPASVFGLNQATAFANKYGCFNLYGTNAKKISTDIDGTWKYVDFSQPISGGQFVSNNIICTAFLIKRKGDPTFGSNTVLAVFQDDRWWFANFGALTFVVTAIIGDQPQLYGILGNKLYALFSDTVNPPATLLKTALWAMEDELADKQVIRAGFEVTPQSGAGSFTLQLDGTGTSSQAAALNVGGNVTWVNNAGTTVQWVNNALTPVQWYTSQYLLYSASAPGMFSKYVGATIASVGYFYQFSAFDMDYKLGARW